MPWRQGTDLAKVPVLYFVTGGGGGPLLVMDMWEHAYYLQYRNKKEKWIVNFWEMINWADVERRLDNAICVDLAVEGPPQHAAA